MWRILKVIATTDGGESLLSTHLAQIKFPRTEKWYSLNHKPLSSICVFRWIVCSQFHEIEIMFFKVDIYSCLISSHTKFLPTLNCFNLRFMCVFQVLGSDLPLFSKGFLFSSTLPLLVSLSSFCVTCIVCTS